MIQKRSISISTFIKTWLPQHKRQPNRLNLFGLLLTPFSTMMAEFIVWRNAVIKKAYVSNQTMSIEWYLNELFDPTLRRIYIITNDAQGVPMGLRATEPSYKQAMGLRATEPLAKVAFPLRGEDPTIGLYNFGVMIPTALASAVDDIRGIVMQKKLAGKTFTIIQF